MEELELTRSATSRRMYELGTIGSLHLNGWLMRSATAHVGPDTFTFERTSWYSAAAGAQDSDGRAIGVFAPHALRRGGTLTWRGAGYTVRPATPFRERYQLADGDRELASIRAKGWWGWGSRRPVTMQLARDDVDPGLLLFAAFVVRLLANKADSDASAATAATSSAGSGG
jgi:hypothetical protein